MPREIDSDPNWKRSEPRRWARRWRGPRSPRRHRRPQSTGPTKIEVLVAFDASAEMIATCERIIAAIATFAPEGTGTADASTFTPPKPQPETLAPSP